MQVGVDDVAYPMTCDHCRFKWMAIVQATVIEWDEDDIELHHGNFLECPECHKWTEIDYE